MTKASKKLPASSIASPHTMSAQEQLQFVGEPALLAYESRDEYLELQDAVFAELKPQGPLEAQFIEDVLYTTWDIRRFRRARAELIHTWTVVVGEPPLAALLRADPAFEDLDSTYEAERAASKMMKTALAGNRQEFEKVEKLLAIIGTTWAELHASAIEFKLPELERIDRLLDRAERSRQATLKDFCFLQASKAIALEKRSDQAIEDLSVGVIETYSK